MSARKPVVLVTGASKGIGLAVTKLLLQKFNAKVVALARTQTADLSALSSDSLLFIGCDVANEAQLTASIAKAKESFNYLDGLVLNAAILDPMTRIGDNTPIGEWKKHFDVNFFSLVTALNSSLPSLRESEFGGKVVFVSSGAAEKGAAGWGPYNASKAAMNSLCRTLAQEEPDVVSVAVRPGMVDTNMQDRVRAEGGSHMIQSAHELFLRVHAEGKLVKPEDCGHVIAALSLRTPKELSGRFVSWDSEECRPFRKEQ